MKVKNSLKALTKSLTAFNKDYEHIIDNIQKGYVTDLVKFQEDLPLKLQRIIVLIMMKCMRSI